MLETTIVAMILTSAAFAANGTIPREYTCEGADQSPPLQWSGVPAGTKSFALIVDDPDAPDPRAPRITWVHWVVYNLSADLTGLEADQAKRGMPAGSQAGLNDWKRTGYGGPCPPVGRHRYFHHLYALDVVLPFLEHVDKVALLDAMRGHVLAEAQLVGTYEKGRINP